MARGCSSIKSQMSRFRPMNHFTLAAFLVWGLVCGSKTWTGVQLINLLHLAITWARLGTLWISVECLQAWRNDELKCFVRKCLFLGTKRPGMQSKFSPQWDRLCGQVIVPMNWLFAWSLGRSSSQDDEYNDDGGDDPIIARSTSLPNFRNLSMFIHISPAKKTYSMSVLPISRWPILFHTWSFAITHEHVVNIFGWGVKWG